MPKTYSSGKPVRSFRMSQEGIDQLKAMAALMGRSESDVIEVALDRMYREEIRFNRRLRDKADAGDAYRVQGETNENQDRSV